MKKILVPTDFSKNAYAALFYVSKLFSGEPLQITLLHSFSDEISTLTSRVDIGRSEGIVEKLYKQSEEDGKQLMHNITLDMGTLPHIFTMVSTSAPLSQTINIMVSSEGYDLVVMGTKGRTGAEDALMGSTTTTISKTLEGCPLLHVPREVDFVIPLHIAFASDYNEFFQLSKLKPLLQLVKLYNSKIHIAHVGIKSNLNEEQLVNLEKFQNNLTEFDTEFHWLPKRASISKTLYNFMDEKEIDLLALVYHKHNFIKKLFREAVVHKVGKHTHTPTLVIPIQN